MLDWVEGTGVFNDGTNTWLSANESNKPIACGLNHKIVLPETIGQYTGRTDKNGKKIFEGDILSSPDGTFENTGMGHVLLYKGMWTSFYGQDALGRDCFDELHAVCSTREVVGNIHDNPELLEVMAE